MSRTLLVFLLKFRKHEVTNFLESAGFSRSNPYYIIQQGRVEEIARMKDTDRLELLKDIAGTTVYEERKSESEKIMRETGNYFPDFINRH